MEKMILKWCKEQQWNKKKVVTLGIIFHKALCVYPKHSGGKSNNKIFAALKSWFYGGFKKRAKLSKCRKDLIHRSLIVLPKNRCPSRA